MRDIRGDGHSGGGTFGVRDIWDEGHSGGGTFVVRDIGGARRLHNQVGFVDPFPGWGFWGEVHLWNTNWSVSCFVLTMGRFHLKCV